jgi:hypothetical protein
MKPLRLSLLLAALVVPLPAWAGQLVLSFNDGRVTLKAADVSLRQILVEWARLGQVRIVGLERVAGSPVTLELVDVPEKQALEILLRSVAGYVAAPRQRAATATASRFDRLILLPTSVASAAPVGTPRPAAFAPPVAPLPDPAQLANQEPDSNDSPNPPGVPVFNPDIDPAGAAVAPPPAPGTIRPFQSPSDPNQPVTEPEPPAGPLMTDRPGVIPVPPRQPRP